MIKELMLYLRVAERNFPFYKKESVTLIYNAVLHSLVEAEEVSIYLIVLPYQVILMQLFIFS